MGKLRHIAFISKEPKKLSDPEGNQVVISE